METACQACRAAPTIVLVDDDDPEQPYLLCPECGERLKQKALRPLQWFNLASIHGWRKYLLNDEFYDEDGTALQPDTNCSTTAGPPAPSLPHVAGSLERLTDYCITRWSIEAQAYEAFTTFPAEAVLKELDRRLATRNQQVFEVCLDICANALGEQAASWVRGKFPHAKKEGALFSWAEAAAKCLPHPEGLRLTIGALQDSTEKELHDRKLALLWFRSPEVLDWIEAHIPKATITEDWGRLAALSAFDWNRAQKWLRSGRPLSLVAIDALDALIQRPGEAPIVSQLKPRLQGCPERADIREELQRYQTVDDTPRTDRKCRFIIAHLDELRVG